MFCGPVGNTRAQIASIALEEGLAAFEAGQYEDAAISIRRATRRRDTRAEAHYQLARLYWETPLRNLKIATNECKKALNFEGRDARFLSLRLELYLADSTNISSRMERLGSRRRLAQQVLVLDPSNVLALEEMGRVYLDDLHWNVIAVFRFNTGYFERRRERSYRKAESYFLKALMHQPDRMSSYRHLFATYVYLEEYEAAKELVEMMQRHRPDEADTWLYSGLIHHNLSEADRASESFKKALIRLDPASVAIFEDISLFLSENNLLEYKSDSTAYVDCFWDTRDPRMLTSANERRNEHYARLVYADLIFREPRGGRRGWDTERGQIFLRYGTPAESIVTNSHYNRRPRWNYGDFSLVFDGFNGYYTLYSPSAKELSGPIAYAGFWDNDFVLRAREIRREWPERYHHEEPGRRITLAYLLSSFKGEEGKTDLYVTYGIPIDNYEIDDPGIEVNIHTGVFLIDTEGVVDGQTRQIHGLSPEWILPAGEMNVWIDSYHFTVKPSDLEISVEFETESGETVGYQRDPVIIDHFAPGSLTISDIMPAYLIEELGTDRPVGRKRIVREGLAITPVPAGVFRIGQPLYLYFEAYQLELDPGSESHYEVEAVLTRREKRSGLERLVHAIIGGGSEGVSVRFEGHGKSPDDGIYLIMDTHAEKAGTYDLLVRLIDRVNDQSVSSKRTLILEE